MSRAGEIDRFREDGFPTPPSPPPSWGSPAVAARRRRRRGGGDPNNVPRVRRGATAVANAVAFFAMMDAFVCWRVGCCFVNGGSNVLALTACTSRQPAVDGSKKAGGGRRRRQRQGGGDVASWWAGGRRHDERRRGGGEGGARRAGGGRLDERGGGGRREASGRRRTGQTNKRVGAHNIDIVGGGDGGSDSGDSSWLPQIGGAPSLMPGTAAPATVPAPGGVDDADNAPMAVGSGRGGGERRRRRRSSC